MVLTPLADHLSDYGIRSIAEIFDGDPPSHGRVHRPSLERRRDLRGWHELSRARGEIVAS